MMVRPLAALLFLLSGVVACVDDRGPATAPDPMAAPPLEEGIQMRFETTAPAGEEIWKCSVYRTPDVWPMINRVESFQNEGVHHMDIMALDFAMVKLEPGVYDCADLYAKHERLMEDGLILFAAQSAEQVIQLPEGVIANLPPSLLVMHEIHYVNTSDQDVDIYSIVNAYTLPPPFEIKGEIWGGVVRDDEINIPANTPSHTEWTRCVMNGDIDLLFLSSHTHQLGREVTIYPFDGTDVGEEPIYSNTDWQTPFLQSFDTTPLHIPEGQGLEFRCEFSNSGSEAVTWGFAAADEMCQIALVYTPGSADLECEPVASSDDLH